MYQKNKGQSSKLDNPVWHSLNEVHKGYCLEYDSLKFYDPAYCPFGGSTDPIPAVKGISQYSLLTEKFFVVGEKPELDISIELEQNLICNQMILDHRIHRDLTESITPLTTNQHRLDLFDLVTLVQPGYFRKRTADLGRYFGIYSNGQLVAAAGERMKMNDFTEVSAIVTHPDHTRKGYAIQLTKYTTDLVFDENKSPYLHCLETNYKAISLYEKLGFVLRRKISFWKLNRKTLLAL